MSTVEFYYMPESPPCRTVEMVAELAGVKLNKHNINLGKGEQHTNTEFVALNPLHKVPVLKDDSMVITESRVIAMYLVQKYMPADNSLYPSKLEHRIKVDELIHQDANLLWAAASKLLRPVLFQGVKQLNETDNQEFRKILSYFETKLDSNGAKFMIGDQLTLGDVVLAASLSFVEAFDYDLGEFKQLLSYIQRLKQSIPNYSEINDKPVDNLRQLIKSRQQAA